jgi:hypothetical protein
MLLWFLFIAHGRDQEDVGESWLDLALEISHLTLLENRLKKEKPDVTHKRWLVSRGLLVEFLVSVTLPRCERQQGQHLGGLDEPSVSGFLLP